MRIPYEDGGAYDPDVDEGVIRIRREVLAALLRLGRDERGIGVTATSVELAAEVSAVIGEEVSANAAGQAGRHFSAELTRGRRSVERCIFWGNPKSIEASYFGKSREHPDERVELVLATYDGRLAREALERHAREAGLIDEIAPEELDATRGPDADTEDDAPGARPENDPVHPDPPRKDDLADAPTPVPDVEYVAKQENPGLTEQNSPDDRSPDDLMDQFGEKSVPSEETLERTDRVGDLVISVRMVNDAVLGFRIENAVVSGNAAIVGTCKWDGCYDLRIEGEGGNWHHCSPADLIEALRRVESRRAELIEHAEQIDVRHRPDAFLHRVLVLKITDLGGGEGRATVRLIDKDKEAVLGFDAPSPVAVALVEALRRHRETLESPEVEVVVAGNRRIVEVGGIS